jgi:hypothetical protein
MNCNCVVRLSHIAAAERGELVASKSAADEGRYYIACILHHSGRTSMAYYMTREERDAAFTELQDAMGAHYYPYP